jgi:soluble lytic murein transglycosylase-like protein
LAVVFILSFSLPFPPVIKYLPHGLGFLSPEVQERDHAIREILGVLERYPTGLANVTKEELAEVIYEEANRHHQDPKFILALIATESEFYNWSVSEKGAKGLMQIMPYVAQSLAHELGIEWSGDRTLFNPYLNIRIGIYYLSQLILDFKDVEVALTAYNYGPTYVKNLIERKERIPRDYYRRFLTTYQSI